MRRSRQIVLATAVAAGIACWAPALARATTDLGPIGFGTMVVDDARGHVLVSGPSGDVVDILDYSGNVVGTIPSVYGAHGMVISGRYLYVTESTAGAIVRFDLGSANPAPTTLASGLFQPWWLVMTGGKLWTTVSQPGVYGWGNIASIDLHSGKVNTLSQSYYSPDLATSPGAPSTLFVTEDGLSPGSAYRIDVSSAKPKVRASNTFMDQENVEDLAVSPDGTRVIPASGWPYYFEELSGSTLQPDGVIYPGQAYPSAVAVSAGRGGVLATGLDSAFSGPNISVYPLGTPAPMFTATTRNPSGQETVRPHGLALTADASRVFAVSPSDVYGTDTLFDAFVIP